MANFCPNCGQPLDPRNAFCERCGTRLTQNDYAGNGAVRDGIPLPGFSDRVNHPEILAAVRKTRSTSKLWGFVIVPLPLAGFLLYALITEKMETSEALLYGGFVSLIFLIFTVYSFIQSRPEKSYEAVVTNKYTKERVDKLRDDRGRRGSSFNYDYITVARTTDGKTKKIVESDHSRIWAYDHLKVGDRFRYHPQFVFPYELYDKTQADALYCPACGTKNPVTADRCKRCGVPLLK